MVKNPPANAGDACSIPRLGQSPGVGNGNLLLPVFLPGKIPWAEKTEGYSHGVTTEQTHVQVRKQYLV